MKPFPRSGQIFTIDMILGLVITTAALLALLVFHPAAPAPFRDDVERVGVLMSEGIPEDWNASTVRIAGFLSDGRFNQTKIETFANFTVAEQRKLLGVASQHRIRFSQNGTQLMLCSACGADPMAPEELLPLVRYGILNGTVTTMEVTLWR